MDEGQSARPPASLLVPALIRQVQAEGGFATVLHKGSLYGSSLIIISRDGGRVQAHECLPSLSNRPNWVVSASGEAEVEKFVARQVNFDSDLWIIELDIASAERFIPR